jgi:hypothetical protein
MSDGLPPKRPAGEVPPVEEVRVPSEKRERHVVVPAEHAVPEKPRAEGVSPAVPATVAHRPPQKSPMRQEIENIMEEGLLTVYKELTQKQRLQFKREGERTAARIEQILRHAKVKLIELIRLIRRWLQLLPGVNIFFLEQEAKIKAEKILAMKKDENRH